MLTTRFKGHLYWGGGVCPGGCPGGMCVQDGVSAWGCVCIQRQTPPPDPEADTSPRPRGRHPPCPIACWETHPLPIVYWYTPPVNRMTDRYKNMTCLQTQRQIPPLDPEADTPLALLHVGKHTLCPLYTGIHPL